MSMAINDYRHLRDRVDQRIGELVGCHGSNLTCRAGCCECCTNFSVFPVEYHAILEELRRIGVKKLRFDPDASCGFLEEGLCTVYAVRPMICRTHGLPIAFVNEELSPPEYNVSFCPLNFTETSVEQLVFGPDNTLDVDELNCQLFEINLRFIRELPEGQFEPTDRIPLSQLAEDLQIPAAR